MKIVGFFKLISRDRAVGSSPGSLPGGRSFESNSRNADFTGEAVTCFSGESIDYIWCKGHGKSTTSPSVAQRVGEIPDFNLQW